MYYLEKGLRERGEKWATLGKVLAVLFAIACIGGSFGGGNMVQINQATQQFIDVTGGVDSFLYGRGWVFGVFMAIVVAIIIIGGIKSIAKVTDKIVPFMVGHLRGRGNLRVSREYRRDWSCFRPDSRGSVLGRGHVGACTGEWWEC